MSKSHFGCTSVFLTTIGLLAVSLPGCEPVPAQAPKPPAVTVTVPVQKDVADVAEFTGTTQAVQSLEVRARVAGYLVSVKQYTKGQQNDFQEGAMVKAGTLLFVIEPEPYQAKLAEAEAREKQTQAALKLAQANFDRATRTFQQNAISQEELETRMAQRDAAQADLLRCQADVRQANIDLGYTQITAPFDGRVGRRLVDFGNLVGATEATLLTTIERTKPIYAYFDVNERIVLKIQRWRREAGGADSDSDEPFKVFLGLADEKGYPHEGQLDFVDNAVDPNTGTALVRGVFANEDGLLYPGLFVRLQIPGEIQKDSLLVEERALCTDLEGKFLWTVGQGDVAKKSHVETGPLIDAMRVIRSGIEPGQRYIVSGLQLAREEMPVTPTEATPAPSKPAAAGKKPPPAKDAPSAD